LKHTRIIVTHYGGPEALQVIEEECPEGRCCRQDRARAKSQMNWSAQHRIVAELEAPLPAILGKGFNGESN
jgi:hypothetical protein